MATAFEIAIQVFFCWRKPKNPMSMVTHLQSGDVKQDVLRLRGVQITQRWFIGVMTFSKRSDFQK